MEKHRKHVVPETFFNDLRDSWSRPVFVVTGICFPSVPAPQPPTSHQQQPTFKSLRNHNRFNVPHVSGCLGPRFPTKSTRTQKTPAYGKRDKPNLQNTLFRIESCSPARAKNSRAVATRILAILGGAAPRTQFCICSVFVFFVGFRLCFFSK